MVMLARWTPSCKPSSSSSSSSTTVDSSAPSRQMLGVQARGGVAQAPFVRSTTTTTHQRQQQQHSRGSRSSSGSSRGSSRGSSTACRAMPELVTPEMASIFEQAWGPNVDSTAVASNLFAISIVPYAGFLFHLTRSKKTPPMALFGFYFLLVFVFATIPAGIYAKTVYGTSLANVDFLHGGAESLLTITNLLIVMGFRQAIHNAEQEKQQQQQGGGGSSAEGAEQ